MKLRNLLFALAFAPFCLHAEERDGQKDFDFSFGAFHTQIKYATHPLTGGHDFVDMSGTVTTRKIWGGKGTVEEISVDGPDGHWDGMTVFLYNPKSHQWSQTFAPASTGTLTATPMIGSFKDGRGELICQEEIGGRMVLTRGVWSNIKADSHDFEIDHSTDGGKTWEPAFIAHKTRISS